jgi:RimJ/RimL family protein N-acetyltransferase
MGQAWLRAAELVGEGVLLRPMGPADIQDCFDKLHRQTEVTEWLCWDGPETVQELAPWYLTWPLGDPQRGWDYHFAVIDQADGQFAGVISLRYYDHAYQGDIGYWITPSKWGRGLASEAVRLMTWLAFQHTGAYLVYAEWFHGNEGSRRVLERSHFEADVSGDHHFQKSGKQVFVHFHSLARSRWEELGSCGAPLSSNIVAGVRANSHS